MLNIQEDIDIFIAIGATKIIQFRRVVAEHERCLSIAECYLRLPRSNEMSNIYTYLVKISSNSLGKVESPDGDLCKLRRRSEFRFRFASAS